MKGSIKERGNSYQIRVSMGKNLQTGKYESYFETVTAPTKQESKVAAQKRLRELLVEMDRGIFIKPGKSSLAEYLKAWLIDYCRPNLAGRTLELYTYLCNTHIIPMIGRCPLVDLKPQHLQHMYSEKMASGLSNATVQIIHRIMHKSLKNAVKIGLLQRNVAELVDSPKVTHPEMRIMDEVDYHVFLDRAHDTEYYALFYCYLFTGCRRSELLAVRWQDFDPLLCQLSINRSMQYLHSKEIDKRISFKEPKTSSSRRLIDLSPSTVAVLEEHREAMNKKREMLGKPLLTDNDLIFSHWDGSPLLPDSVTQSWRRIAHRCGLDGIHPHTARHSHASLLLKQGIPAKVIQERLGHSGIGITLNLYAHTTRGMQQQAANKFDEMLLPKTQI